MSVDIFRPQDEVDSLALGRRTEWTAEAMFRWHLERLLHWSAVLDMSSGQVKLNVKNALGDEADTRGRTAPARPKRSRRGLPAQLQARILIRDGLQCVQCGATRDLQIDHVKPVARGGTDDPTNLQVLCGRCNLSKAARYDE